MDIATNEVATLNTEKPAFSILLRPVASNQEILIAWKNYNELKNQLLSKEDFCEVSGQKYPRKSAFRKLALAFGVSVEITEEKRIELANNVIYEIIARATSPNGRFMTAVGSAHSNEKKYAKASDVRAVAQTRATNRAISDLLGGVLGVSAEEVITEVNEPQYVPFQPTEVKKTNYTEAVEKIFSKQAEAKLPEEPASEKQKNLIASLIERKTMDEETRSRSLQAVEYLTKLQASNRIKELLVS